MRESSPEACRRCRETSLGPMMTLTMGVRPARSMREVVMAANSGLRSRLK